MSDEFDEFAMPAGAGPGDGSGEVEGMPPPSAAAGPDEDAGEFAMPPEPGPPSGGEPPLPTQAAGEGGEPPGGPGEFEMPPVPRAVRLTFAFEGDNVSVVSRQPVEMNVRPSDQVSSRETRLGSWVELQGEGGRPLYSQVLPEHFTPDVEVFSPEPGESISRQPVDVASGVFSVVVPDIEEANEVAIFSSRPPRPAPPGAEVAPAGPVEMARFSLRGEGE